MSDKLTLSKAIIWTTSTFHRRNNETDTTFLYQLEVGLTLVQGRESRFEVTFCHCLFGVFKCRWWKTDSLGNKKSVFHAEWMKCVSEIKGNSLVMKKRSTGLSTSGMWFNANLQRFYSCVVPVRPKDVIKVLLKVTLFHRVWNQCPSGWPVS